MAVSAYNPPQITDSSSEAIAVRCIDRTTQRQKTMSGRVLPPCITPAGYCPCSEAIHQLGGAHLRLILLTESCRRMIFAPPFATLRSTVQHLLFTIFFQIRRINASLNQFGTGGNARVLRVIPCTWQRRGCALSRAGSNLMAYPGMVQSTALSEAKVRDRSAS